MKLGADQTGLLLMSVAKVVPNECFTVGEVFTTLWSGVDSLFARVLGCRGYDRLWLQRDDRRSWVQCGPETSERIFPKDEREDIEVSCICDMGFHEEEV